MNVSSLRVVYSGNVPPTRTNGLLVYYFNTHAAGRTADHAGCSLDGCSVQVGHLLLSDLSGLSHGDLTNLGLVRNAGSLVNSARLLEKNSFTEGKKLSYSEFLYGPMTAEGETEEKEEK